MRKELEEFIRLSNYAGQRYDLVQAGGGNASVKFDGRRMFIKASGYMLSEVKSALGWVIVDSGKVSDSVNQNRSLKIKDKRARAAFAENLLKSAIMGQNARGARASIETFMHSLLYKYTLHVHPIVVGAVACRKDWRGILSSIFGDKCALVDYRTPGIELAAELKKVIERYRFKHKIMPGAIFLQNHGLIVTSDAPDETIRECEIVVSRLEKYLKADLEKYKLTTAISKTLNIVGQDNSISYLSTDGDLGRMFKLNKRPLFSPHFCPDTLVYCGIKSLRMRSVDDVDSVRKYYKRYNEMPRVIVYKDLIFFIAANVRKAREIEELIKFHVIALGLARGRLHYLDREELKFLRGWGSEKYRHRLQV